MRRETAFPTAGVSAGRSRRQARWRAARPRRGRPARLLTLGPQAGVVVAAVVGDDIIVSGGQANHQLVKDTEMFDGTKWKEIAPLPTPRDHLAAVSDGHGWPATRRRAS